MMEFVLICFCLAENNLYKPHLDQIPDGELDQVS